MLSRLHFGQNRGKLRRTVSGSSRAPRFGAADGATKSNVLCLNSWFTSLYIKGTEKQPYMGVQLFQAFGLTFRLAVTNAEKGE